MRHPSGPSIRRAAAVALALVPALAACEQRQAPPPVVSDRCPPWTTARTPHDNAPSPYLGCANRMNLKEMLDRPADLVRGRELGPADGDREALAVEKYQKGEVEALESGAPAGEMAFPTTTLGGQ